MKIKIEDYNGQEIFYDEYDDKFVCDISVEDKSKTTKRTSLKDVRKEIDVFKKLNVDFNPFKILNKYNWGDIEALEVTAIRTDGKFVVKKGDNYSSQETAERLIKDFSMYDADILEKANEARRIFDEAGKAYDAEKKRLRNMMKPLDLSKYEHLTNK